MWHAIIRKNHGCTHLIVGRDHAGPGSDSKGVAFYGPYEAQELLKQHEEELGVAMVPFKMMVYVEDQDKYLPQDEVPEGTHARSIVRKHLSSELGLSKEHRDINIRRIGFVASEITKNGGIAICAPIAPYDSVRKEVRQMIGARGGFILVHVATPLEVCEQRDRKGLYAKARAGVVKEFTGISDPYEEPDDSEVGIDTTETTPEEAAQEIMLHLEQAGYVGANAR